MSAQIVFETINPEEQKSKVQFESKIMYNDNGKEVFAEEETEWIYQEFSGFAPKKFIEDPAKRDWVKFQLNPEQKACMNLKEKVLKNDEAFESNRKMIFGKFDRLYKFLPSVKPPKGKDEEELSEAEAEEEDEDKPEKNTNIETKQKFDSVKMKLKMDWFYYYDNKRLDRINTSIIKKAVYELMKNTKTANLDKDKKKAAINALLIKLTFKDEDGKKETIDVLMKDIEQRKEIDTKVFYRKPEKIDLDAKKPSDCTEEELVQIYGDPLESQDVRTPDDLDQYYRNGCYVRLLYRTSNLWASKDKMAGADKRTCGIKYIIYQIDIIQIPYGQNYNSSQKTIYSKYSFGKKSMLINQSVDSVFTSVDKLTNEKHIQPIQESVKETIKEKLNKKEMRVESEDEKSDSDNKSETGSGSESEESGSESEESESDSESEEEVKVKVKPGKKVDKNAKTVVETPSKNGKPTKKTK
jgi:hypothetical protein